MNIHADQSRRHLTVKIGGQGQAPNTVWEHPNQVVVKDWSRNLVIDVPLSADAAQFWPPGPGHRWFVEVSDDSDRQPGTDAVGSVREVILVDRTRAAARRGPPLLYRAGARNASLSKGGKVTVYIPD